MKHGKEGAIVIERALTHMQRLLNLAQASWHLGSPGGDHIHPGTQRTGPTLWSGGNSWVEYSTSGANHREVGEGLRMLYLAPPLSNLCSFIKPFKDGQIMSLAKAFMAFDISLSQGE